MQISVLLHHFTYCRTEHIVPLFKDVFVCLFVFTLLIRERGMAGERDMSKTNVDAYVPPHDHDGPQLSVPIAF